MMAHVPKNPLAAENTGVGAMATDCDGQLQQRIDHQEQLLARWLKAAHGLNNLFLVVKCWADSQSNPLLNEMIDKSVAELRCVVNDSRAKLAEAGLGRNHAESSTDT